MARKLKQKFPTLAHVAAALWWRSAEVDADDVMDVRLQVYRSTDTVPLWWAIRCGPSDYDQDHHGFWGASSITRKLSMRRCRRVAIDLLEQAMEQATEQYAMSKEVA